MKKLKIALIILIIIAITSLGILVNLNNTEVKAIRSEKQLLKIMEKGNLDSEFIENLKELATSKAEDLYDFYYYSGYNRKNTYYGDKNSGIVYEATDVMSAKSSVNYILDTVTTAESSASSSVSKSKSIKDYSTTNIQVENVDEADINKTDGDYIYSISDYQVIITDVRNPEDIKIASKINTNTKLIPEDLMLYNNKLVVIYEKVASSRYGKSETVVKTYNIGSKESPKELKSFKLNQTYYTSRCIANKLYVIASGELTYDTDSEKDKVDRSYEEDGEKKQIPLRNIKYLQDAPSSILTVITTEDLDNPEDEIKISPFLMDVSNAYVSEKSIYLLNQEYESTEVSKNEPLKKLFSLGRSICIQRRI